MALASTQIVRIEPCWYYTKRQHQLTLPGSEEPIRYERLHCLKTGSCLGPDGRAAMDPAAGPTPCGGTPCNPERPCYETDPLLSF